MSTSTYDTTGFQPIVLVGQENYTRWAREFRIASQAAGVWKLFTGDETIPAIPERPKKPVMTEFATRDQKDAALEEYKANLAAYPAVVSDYKLDLDEYEKAKKKASRALHILAKSVDASILGSVDIDEEDPKSAFDSITTICKMQDSRALDIALNLLERLTLGKCANMSEYL
jgi:hypothetical protein